jgi:hypothetical protein
MPLSMNDANSPVDNARRGNDRWIWFGGLAVFALMALSSDRRLLAVGLLLMAVFGFFNDPLSPTPSRLPRPSRVLALSWVCGLLGMAAIVAAALRALA